jgi:hypothetical protein
MIHIYTSYYVISMYCMVHRLNVVLYEIRMGEAFCNHSGLLLMWQSGRTANDAEAVAVALDGPWMSQPFLRIHFLA